MRSRRSEPADFHVQVDGNYRYVRSSIVLNDSGSPVRWELRGWAGGYRGAGRLIASRPWAHPDFPLVVLNVAGATPPATCTAILADDEKST